MAESNYSPIIAAFNVDAYGPDSAAVVDVTRLFTAPPPELSPGATLRGVIDPNRSLIERVAGYPINVEVEAILSATPPGTPNAPVPSPFFPEGGQFPTSNSLVTHWCPVQLPSQPMMPRLWDSRVGTYPQSRVDYSRPEQRAQTRTYINRYRLETRDPGAAMSEPARLPPRRRKIPTGPPKTRAIPSSGGSPRTSPTRRARTSPLGRDLGTELEVLSGLNEGDQVVMNPSDVVEEGASVRVVVGGSRRKGSGGRKAAAREVANSGDPLDGERPGMHIVSGDVDQQEGE